MIVSVNAGNEADQTVITIMAVATGHVTGNQTLDVRVVLGGGDHCRGLCPVEHNDHDPERAIHGQRDVHGPGRQHWGIRGNGEGGILKSVERHYSRSRHAPEHRHHRQRQPVLRLR